MALPDTALRQGIYVQGMKRKEDERKSEVMPGLESDNKESTAVVIERGYPISLSWGACCNLRPWVQERRSKASANDTMELCTDKQAGTEQAGELSRLYPEKHWQEQENCPDSTGSQVTYHCCNGATAPALHRAASGIHSFIK